MPITYTPIATTTISGSSTSTFTFSSVPSTYTDLILVVNAAVTSGTSYIYARWNGDTSAVYSRTELVGNGTSATSSRNGSEVVQWLGGTQLSTVSGAYNAIVQVMNYANTNVFKTTLMRANRATEQTAAVVGLWRSTAAINSVTLTLNSDNFAAGSTFTLYGVKSA
jgi:hypothetical protein